MISVHVDGLKELEQNLKTLSERTSRSLLRQALVVAAEPVRARMAQLAPSGDPEQPNLREEIGTGANARSEIDITDVAVAVGPTRRGYYGSFQELGTSFHGAQPFARPAFDTNWMVSLGIFAVEMWRELAGRRLHKPTQISDARPIGGPGGGIV